MIEYQNGLITGQELHGLIDQGVITALHDNVNAASIDVRLGNKFLCERYLKNIGDVNPLNKSDSHLEEVVIQNGECFYLLPNRFTLAQTMEVFNLPNNISAQFILKSSVARAGLSHALAGWADAGWNGSVLTLELKNYLTYNAIVLTPGTKVGQMVFHRHNEVPKHMSYATKGQYNNDQSVSASKGVK